MKSSNNEETKKKLSKFKKVLKKNEKLEETKVQVMKLISNSQKRLNSLGSILEMISNINEKLLTDEVLSGDPVLITLCPQFDDLYKIVRNEIESELKRIEAFKKEMNQLMDEKDAGPAFKK